ncbi:MAG: helix-turn-helix transcriptional regulator [Proteobacteria bacterium]|nr:helix-turn-helix transcriptional regulator [Pseudomonadota bacterium]
MSRLTTPPERVALGLRLAAVRRQANLSQSEFALSLGMSPRAYANYERGEREAPGAVFRALWEHYQIDPIWLLSGPSEEPPKAGVRTLNTALLQQTLERLKRHLAATKSQLDPALEAQVVRFLYVYALNGNELRDAYVADTLELARAANGKG